MLTDEQIVIVALYILATSFTFALGERKHPSYFFLCGLIGLSFAYYSYTLLSSLVIAVVIAAVSVSLFVYGFVQKPPGGTPGI